MPPRATVRRLTGLALGSLSVLLGLIVVVPVLGHATWHLYRKVVGRRGICSAQTEHVDGLVAAA